jgi:putative transposase
VGRADPGVRSNRRRSALAAMKEIDNAEDIDKAQVAIKTFELDYGAKYPKAVAKITDDADVLLEFYKSPAGHRVHLRTTNPIESTFATARLRTKVTKGPGSRGAGIAMAYKLIDAAQARWRAVGVTPRGVVISRAMRMSLMRRESDVSSWAFPVTRMLTHEEFPQSAVGTDSEDKNGLY